ncbi:MAG: NAD(P)-binding protein, partial [Actinobacteria bacterium]|nr:NAD(P)-binding protein [Actinomycetota bacterium]
MSNQKLPRTAVIGAGSSGITALKTLAERGFDVTCFEASNRV